MKVAFIGLGIMGSRMAANILKNGHKLTVYNRTRKKADALGKSLGIPAERIADTLIGGPVAAPFLAAKRSKIEQDGYKPEFPLRLMRKDLHLAALEAYEHGISLPVTNAVKELNGAAVQRGLSEEDFAAVCKVLAQT